MKLKSRISILFGMITFIVLIFSMIMVGVFVAVMVNQGVIKVKSGLSGITMLGFSMLVSVLISMIMYLFMRNLPLNPIDTLVDGMTKLKEGNYETRINLGESEAGKNIADTFNTLASELGNTEMLREDFINNFSHEFKTPIVSILGFAKMLNKSEVSEDKKREYLKAIEEEAERLTNMATGVLNLTKIENQEILTEKKEYNLSEQIRDSVLMLEKKWTDKNLSLNLDFDEVLVFANEETLKQVWVNLIDNAIKFSEEYTEITISIDSAETTRVRISNFGVEIPQEERDRIFNKFYQIDKSHSSSGNGIGLSIAKKIVELHQGTIYAQSQNGVTTFTVELPKK